MDLDLIAGEIRNGVRYDTFLVDYGLISEELLQPHRTAEEEEKIRQGILEVLNHHNRLPDDEERSSDDNDKSAVLKMEVPKNSI